MHMQARSFIPFWFLREGGGSRCFDMMRGTHRTGNEDPPRLVCMSVYCLCLYTCKMVLEINQNVRNSHVQNNGNILLCN